jgi:hypothetical protein
MTLSAGVGDSVRISPKRIQMGEQPVSIRVIRTIRGEWAVLSHEVVTSLSRSPVSSFPISRF